jgi:phosphomannomutase
MDRLIVSVSGIRGVVGRTLTPDVAMRFAVSYAAELTPGPVAVSRDGRSTGDMLAHAVTAGLSAAGREVVDLGVAATPTVGFFVQHAKLAGAVQISASHNPPEWNGLKLYRREGFVLSAGAGKRVAERFESGDPTFVEWNAVGHERVEPNPLRPHLARVSSLVDVERIRARKFRVTLDANHGSGALLGRELLTMLGCDARILGADPDGRFEHQPEPTEANLGDLCAAVRANGANVGFAVDPDADRLALVDETGAYIGEELTLALAILHRTRRQTGPVVLNLSTSLASEEVARRAGCTVLRTPVGEVHVAEKMLASGAVMGGEGNGGVIDPRVGYIRDSAVGMALTLDLLAERNVPLSKIVEEIPAFALVKTKFPARPERLAATFARVESAFGDATADRQDGLRLAWPDAWVQVRASNTEPIVRVFAESADRARAEALCAKVGELVADG